MYIRIAAALVALVFATFAQAEVMVVNTPYDGFLNLRTGPGTRYAIITQMGHGSEVDTLESVGRWVRVEHESGAVGWASRKYLAPVRPGPVTLYVYSPGDGFLNLRTGPGTRYAIITPMYNGTQVQALERSGNWARVHTEYGDEGWAYLRYFRQ